MRRAVAIGVLATALCAFAAPARAEVFTWRDENGAIHMADDLSKVPEEYRKGAQKRPPSESRRWNKLPESSAWKSAPVSVSRTTPAETAGKTHVLHVDRAGREMLLSATLDGTPNLPFVVDTGAMLNTIPRWAAQEMGVDLSDEDLPRVSIVGVGGQAMMVPVITVGTVRIGTALVQNVEMAVVSTMNKGLLGMPFFNHFRVGTDPTKGTLTLTEIDLNAVEGVYGGLDESSWRSKFGQIHHQLRNIEKWRERIPPEFETASASYRDQLDGEERYWRRQLDDLEDKATRAGVPQRWRE